MSNLDSQLAAWQERMTKKIKNALNLDKNDPDKLREDYMKRTGRSDMTPAAGHVKDTYIEGLGWVNQNKQ